MPQGIACEGLQIYNRAINKLHYERVNSMTRKINGKREGLNIGSIDRSIISDLIRWQLNKSDEKRHFQGRNGLRKSKVETIETVVARDKKDLKVAGFSEQELNDAYTPIEKDVADLLVSLMPPHPRAPGHTEGTTPMRTICGILKTDLTISSRHEGPCVDSTVSCSNITWSGHLFFHQGSRRGVGYCTPRSRSLHNGLDKRMIFLT